MDILEKNKDITDLSNFRTPAKAKYYYEISSEDDLWELFQILSFSKDNSLSILWVSSWTNMLFAFELYDGIVIKNSLRWWTYDKDTQTLQTYSAEKIWDIAYRLEKDYWQNLWHRFIWLPGSVAGAIYWNAGCFWLETENNFVSCKVMNIDNGQILEIQKDEMNFSYRNSILKEE